MRRSKHNLSSTHLTSFDMGELIPINLIETLPGDSMQVSTSLLVRCAPMLAPPMHPVRVRVHHWFVPYRLVWDGFEDMITGGPDGNNVATIPRRNAGTITQGSLLNYLGLPVGSVPAYSALPVRAYQLIWNEFYRDQDLQAEAVVSTANGPDTTTSTTLQNVSWEKDYFTSSRPWEQKGPQVTIPLAGNAPVNRVNNAPAVRAYVAGSNSNPADNAMNTVANLIGSNSGRFSIDPQGGLVADLASVSGVTVNALRQSLAIQRFEEARSMYGSRYSEYLRALGVTSSDGRLNRPEYLGGGVQTIQFSEVMQTAADGTNPVGTLRGYGITAMRSNRFRKFFEEHGVILTLASVLPKTIYTDGLPRMWNRQTKFDFWQRELEHIGQQAILNREIRAAHATPEGVFGYQDRYDEYRRSWSRVTAEFATSTLNYWHFARAFTTDPALNSSFVSAVPPKRPFAASATDVLYVQAYHSVRARRLVTQSATPRTF